MMGEKKKRTKTKKRPPCYFLLSGSWCPGWIWIVLPWRPQPSCPVCPQYIYTHTSQALQILLIHLLPPCWSSHSESVCVYTEGQSTAWLQCPNHKTSSKIAKTTTYPTAKFLNRTLGTRGFFLLHSVAPSDMENYAPLARKGNWKTEWEATSER